MQIPHKWSRDEAIELCLEALATGGVYGVSANHDPDILTTGTSFAQNSNGERHMWRDWGLFEAHFSRWRAGTPWNCDFLMVQAHRMKKPPKFSALRKELHRYGHELTDPARTIAGADYLTVTASGSEACVGRDSDKYQGRVMKISAMATPPFPHRPKPGPRTSPDHRTALHAITTIAAAPDSSWDAWLDQRHWSPDDWIWHLGMLHTLHRDEPDRRATWATFGLWLLEQARIRAIWPTPEWTWRWADFVLDRRPDTLAPTARPTHQHPDARPGEVAREHPDASGEIGRQQPVGVDEVGHERSAAMDGTAHERLVAVGEVARACLAAVPMTPAEAVALPTEWRALTPEDIHRSRMTMALLRLAAADLASPIPPPSALAEWERFLYSPNFRRP